jgi:hypothetical protein
MINVADVVSRYMAVWNESDAEARRQRIRDVWAPEGGTCNRTIDAHGYGEIEARVVGSWSKWIREGKYVFRPMNVAAHHDAVKFDWKMTAVETGVVEGVGVSFLILGPGGKIVADYQFNPTVNEAPDLAERYIAMWREPDPERRRALIADLYGSDAAFYSDYATVKGRIGVEAEAAAAEDAYLSKGCVFAPAGFSQRHHDVAMIYWRMSRADSAETTLGCDLLVFDEDGRISADYQFETAESAP